MPTLNYRHLEYFWAVVHHGSVTRAAEALYVSQPAISSQIRKLEKSMGAKLLRKSGRRLVLTDTGRTAFEYADEIFSMGRELQETVRGDSTDRPVRLTVGLIDALPKLIAYRLLAPVLSMSQPIRLTVRENPPEALFADLAVRRLDMVLTDSPLPTSVNLRAYNHLLGESGTSALAVASIARRYAEGFPGSLEGAPVLLPTDNTTLRRSLDRWFEQHDLRPEIVSEIEDSAVIKVFAMEGAGVCFVPTVVEQEVAEQYHLQRVGRIPEIRETFYAISGERRIRHPAVATIRAAAADWMGDGDETPAG